MYKIIFSLFILFLTNNIYAEVSFISATSGAPKKTITTDYPLPKDLTIDDEMLTPNDKFLYKYIVCLEGTQPIVKPDKNAPITTMEEGKINKYYKIDRYEKIIRCKEYFGGDALLDKKNILNASYKDLSMEVFAPKNLFIKDIIPITKSRTDFILSDKAQMPYVKTKIIKEGTIFKKILVDEKKIKKLYNLNIDLSSYISSLIDKKDNNSLPIRITIYDQDGGQNQDKQLAVIVFDEKEKFLYTPSQQPTDIKIYGIEPDFIVEYIK